MTIGPWYVGDTPTQDIVVTLTRDGTPADLSGFTSGSVLLYAPDGVTPVAWPGVVSISGSSVTIPKPASSPFGQAGMFKLFVKLTTPGGVVETFDVSRIEVRTTALTWPPQLWELKQDASLRPDDTKDDDRLQQTLDAAVSFYERVKSGKIDFTNSVLPELPTPTSDMRLGIVRLAYRWHIRRRSPAMLMALGDLGETRLPSFDPDIERLLQIGRRRGFVFA